MKRVLRVVLLLVLVAGGALFWSFLPANLPMPAPIADALPPASPPAGMSISVLDTGSIQSRAVLAFRGGAFGGGRELAGTRRQRLREAARGTGTGFRVGAGPVQATVCRARRLRLGAAAAVDGFKQIGHRPDGQRGLMHQARGVAIGLAFVLPAVRQADEQVGSRGHDARHVAQRQAQAHVEHALLDHQPGGVAVRDMADLVREHVRPIVAEQVRSPGDHLLGEIVRNYKDAGVLDFEQMVIFTVGLVTGGFETTAWMMACALGALLLHPEVLDEVRRDRSLLNGALEESMRWTPSFVGVLRQTTAEVTLSGVTIPADAPVILCLASAHYDEEHFPSPEIFDIRRKADHMLFASGPHYCLGAPLARLEARTAISRLLDAMPGLRLEPGKEHPFVLGVLGSAMHGPEALHVLYDDPLTRQAGSLLSIPPVASCAYGSAAFSG